jgi:hypothetical protein
LRNPTTGIAGWARAASGHAAAPPSSVMNSRRFNFRTPLARVELQDIDLIHDLRSMPSIGF